MTALVLAVVTGCVDVPGEETGEVGQAIMDCEAGPCPKNSPVIATFPFWDLNTVPGVPNAQGVTLDKFLIGGVPYDLIVSKGRIIGKNGWGTVMGPALAGAQIWVRRGARQYVIKLTSVTNVNMWATPSGGGPIPQIEAYRMDWTDVINGLPVREYRNVCANAELPREFPDVRGVPTYVTFVFEGERINAFQKIIYDFDTTGTWFNLGCAGHTLSKMYLTGHVQAAQGIGYTNTIKDRQAIMKMFAADYCGTGYSFTKPGVSLDWAIDDGSMSYLDPWFLLTREARWNAHGATCLNLPRVEANPTADTMVLWPLPGDVTFDIKSRCDVLDRPCGGGIFDFDFEHLITANPP